MPPIVNPNTPQAQRAQVIVDDQPPGPPDPDFEDLDSDVEDVIAEYHEEMGRTARNPARASRPVPTAQRLDYILGMMGERATRSRNNASGIPVYGTSHNEEGPYIDSTYDIITEGRQRAEVQHPIAGQRTRQRRSLFRPPYRPAREIPLTSLDACRCDYLNLEVAPYVLARPNTVGGPQLLRSHRVELRNHARSQALGGIGTFRAWNNRNLVEMRQSRASIGLDTIEYDVEIARRVLEDPQAWGELGALMTEVGWVDEADRDGPNYRLE